MPGATAPGIFVDGQAHAMANLAYLAFDLLTLEERQ
jgi:hypothetical protein